MSVDSAMMLGRYPNGKRRGWGNNIHIVGLSGNMWQGYISFDTVTLKKINDYIKTVLG